MVFQPSPEVDELFLGILTAGEERESELFELLSVLHDVRYETDRKNQLKLVEKLIVLASNENDEVIQQNTVRGLRHFHWVPDVQVLLEKLVSDPRVDLDVRYNAITIIRSHRETDAYRSILKSLEENGLNLL